jgi:hypothetical protein
MKNTISILSITLLLSYSSIYSQENADYPKKWGIEADLVQPFLPEIGIIRINATRTLFSLSNKMKGDLILGAYIRPNIKHDVVEKINEYMVVAGYRHYFWKGLHIEAKSNMGYAWGTRNLVDFKNYETATWFWETNIGYKINILKKNKLNLYAIPQFGAIGNIVGDIGPRNGKPDNFIQGSLLVGVNF